MFTGIIRFLGRILSISSSFLTISVNLDFVNQPFPLRIGDSVAVNGCCLTVTSISVDEISFGLMDETWEKTNFKYKRAGQNVHVERALIFGQSIDGDLTAGHILETVQLLEKSGERWTFTLPVTETPRYKSTVILDGVSLTVADLTSSTLTVCLTECTRLLTLFDQMSVGDEVNLELPIPTAEIKKIQRQDWMQFALKTSKKGRLTAPSNPWVGCAIVAPNDSLLASGYHRQRGQAHAERDALNQIEAFSNLKDVTLYCTLEPCNHTGLQPPCTDLIIERGIRKVVVGILDPDPRVSGSGVAKLRDAGIQVDVVYDTRVHHNLRSYLHHRIHFKPYVVVKVAMTLNGVISGKISGTEAANQTMKLRAKSQAILVGTGTALHDQPQLTVRGEYHKALIKQPLRCFLDRTGRITEGPLMDTSLAATVAFTGKVCPPSVLETWNEMGVEPVVLNTKGPELPLADIFENLGSRGVLQCLVEPGQELFASLLNENLINELIIYWSPQISPGLSAFEYVRRFNKHYKIRKTKALGSDLMVVYQPI